MMFNVPDLIRYLSRIRIRFFGVPFIFPFNDQGEDLQLDITKIVSEIFQLCHHIIFFRNIKQEKDFYVNLHRVKI